METIVHDLEFVKRDPSILEDCPGNVQHALTVVIQNGKVIPHEPDLFCKNLGELWMVALNNRVLRRKLGKLVDRCCGVYPETMDKSMSQCLVALLSGNRKQKALMDVSWAIESSMAVCKCLEKLWISCLTSVKGALEEVCGDQEINGKQDGTLTMVCSSTEKSNTFVVAAKVFLQLVQLYPQKFGSALSMQQEEETGLEFSDEQKVANGSLQEILKHILLVLQSQVSPKDAVIFCGTALAVLENVCRNQGGAPSFSGLLSRSYNVQFIQFGETRISVPTVAARNNYSMLAIASGLLNVGHRDILLRLIPGMDECTTTMDVILSAVIMECRNLNDGGVKYFAFSVLLSWIQAWKRMKADAAAVSMKCTSEDINVILQLCYENADDLVDGVPQSVQTVFSSLLDLVAEDSDIGELVSDILDRQLNNPWFVKGKYGFLSNLVPHMTLEQIKAVSSKIATDICCKCMATCTLPSACNELYKTLLSSYEMRAGKQMENNFLKWWLACWKDVIWRGLCSRNAVCRRNVGHYMIPWTLEKYPLTYEHLVAQGRDISGSSSADVGCLYGYAVLVKLAKKCGILRGREVVDDDILLECLKHEDDEVRVEAFSSLCISPQRTEPLAQKEATLILNFITRNLNCAHSAFRQQLFVQIKDLMLRTRDSCAALYRRMQQAKDQGDRQSALERVLVSIGLLNRLDEEVSSALFPGASFQRRRTALQIFFICLDALYGLGKRNKIQSDAFEKWMAWIKAEKRFTLITEGNMKLIIACLEDQHDEVRELALKILLHPGITKEDICALGDNYVKTLSEVAAYLLSSPKAQEAESGAVLLEFIVVRFALQIGMVITVENCRLILSQREESMCIEGVEQLCRAIRACLCVYQTEDGKLGKDILQSSVTFPRFGYLFAARRLLVLLCSIAVKEQNTSAAEEQIAPLLEEVTQICCRAHLEMLQILSGSASVDSTNKDVSPSFADMREALDDILRRSPCYGSYSSLIGPQQCRDLVLSMAWLNLKGILLVVSDLGPLLLLLEKTRPDEFLRSVKALGNVAYNCLVKCRHKGVIESGYASLGKLCRCLSTTSSFRVHMQDLVMDVLKAMTSGNMNTSVTKRSAGVPLFVQSVLSGLSKGHSDQALKDTMSTLFEVARQPPNVGDDYTTDLPQVHALNILKALFRDTSLGNSLLPFAEVAVILTVEGFSSSLWSIRNASTLLLGTLLPRMLGQKMTQTDAVQQNAFTAPEFFMKYPSLEQYFEKCLRLKTCSEGSQPLIRPRLLPVLTFLSKLRMSSTKDFSLQSGSPFVDTIKPLLSCPVYIVRTLAAQSLVNFIPKENFVSFYDGLSPSIQRGETNECHGLLLLLLEYFRNCAAYFHVINVDVLEFTYRYICVWVENLAEKRKELVTSGALMDLISTYSMALYRSNPQALSEKLPVLCGRLLKETVIPDDKRIGHSLSAKKLAVLMSKVLVQSGSYVPGFAASLLSNVCSSTCLDLQVYLFESLVDDLQSEINLRNDFVTEIANHLIQLIEMRIRRWFEFTELMRACVQCLFILLKFSNFTTCLHFRVEHIEFLISHCHSTDCSARTLPELIVYFSICLRYGIAGAAVRKIDIGRENLNGLDCVLSLYDKYGSPPNVEDIRLAVAQGLQLTLAEILELWRADGDNMRGLNPFRVFKSALILLDDEDDRIRKTACAALSFLHPQDTSLPRRDNSQDPSSTKEKLFAYCANYLWFDIKFVGGVFDMVLDFADADEEDNELPTELRRSALFQQEGPNLYAEHAVLATELCQCLSTVLPKYVEKMRHCDADFQQCFQDLVLKRSRRFSKLYSRNLNSFVVINDTVRGVSGFLNHHSVFKAVHSLLSVFPIIREFGRLVNCSMDIDVDRLTAHLAKMPVLYRHQNHSTLDASLAEL